MQVHGLQARRMRSDNDLRTGNGSTVDLLVVSYAPDGRYIWDEIEIQNPKSPSIDDRFWLELE